MLSWHDAEITVITGAQKKPGAGAAASGDLPTESLAPRCVFAGGSESPAAPGCSPSASSRLRRATMITETGNKQKV